MCGENMCWNCEESVNPNTLRCFMKHIKLHDDSREKRKRATKKHKRRRGSGDLLDELAVDEDGDDNTQEDEGEDEEGQKYLFYDIEARQEDGRHIANLLIVQDEKRFETVFKGEDCVEKFGEWLLDGTHQGAIVIAHNSRSYVSSSQIDSEWCKNHFHGIGSRRNQVP